MTPLLSFWLISGLKTHEVVSEFISVKKLYDEQACGSSESLIEVVEVVGHIQVS